MFKRESVGIMDYQPIEAKDKKAICDYIILKFFFDDFGKVEVYNTIIKKKDNSNSIMLSYYFRKERKRKKYKTDGSLASIWLAEQNIMDDVRRKEKWQKIWNKIKGLK